MTEPIELAAHELGGDGPPLILIHGNGLHAHTLAPLAAALPDRRCIGLDLRGFGHSESPTVETFDWSTHSADIHHTVDRHDLIGADVFGNSMGGAMALITELDAPGTFGRIATYEPIVTPPPWNGESQNFERTLRRKARFESVEAAIERLGAKLPWSEVSPDALRLYCEWGLRPDGEEWVLRADPRHEANNYLAGSNHETWNRLPELSVDVLVMAGGEGAPAEMAPGIVERLPRATLALQESVGHFGPMQDPALVAAAVREWWASVPASR